MPAIDFGTHAITLAELGLALTSLGFRRQQTDRFIAFREVEHDAVIILPLLEEGDVVDEAHLVAVRNTVTGKGIASEAQFRSSLRLAEAPSTRGRKVGSSGSTARPKVVAHHGKPLPTRSDT